MKKVEAGGAEKGVTRVQGSRKRSSRKRSASPVSSPSSDGASMDRTPSFARCVRHLAGRRSSSGRPGEAGLGGLGVDVAARDDGEPDIGPRPLPEVKRVRCSGGGASVCSRPQLRHESVAGRGICYGRVHQAGGRVRAPPSLTCSRASAVPGEVKWVSRRRRSIRSRCTGASSYA